MCPWPENDLSVTLCTVYFPAEEYIRRNGRGCKKSPQVIVPSDIMSLLRTGYIVGTT